MSSRRKSNEEKNNTGFVRASFNFYHFGLSDCRKKVKQYMPSAEIQDLNKYFAVETEQDAAIEVNHEIIEEKAFQKDGVIYLDYNYVHDQLNDRFYWDANENTMLYTTSDHVIKISAESESYYIGKKKTA